MKYAIFMGMFFISCICSVAQTTKTYTIPFNREDFTIINTEHGSYIESDKHDLRLEEDTLKPAIPYVIVKVLLPDMQNMLTYSFDAIFGHEEEGVVLCGNPKILPTNTETIPAIDSLSYPLADYPFRVDFVNIGSIDGYHFATFKVFPVSYRAGDSKLVWASNVELSITTAPIEGTVDASRYRHKGNRNKMLQDILLNPEMMEECFSPFSIAETNEIIDYIIITSSELKPAFQLLAEWKNTKGVRTKIITTDSIYANYEGATNQLKIKKCIKDFHDNSNTEYVLLGGDDNIIPVQRCYARVNELVDSLMPVDLFYACLDGPFDWNPNGDNYVGHENDSVDINDKVYLTRLPVQNIDDAYSFIDKLLIYEKDPPENEYFTKMLLAGVKLFKDMFPHESDAEYKSDKMYQKHIQPYWDCGNVTRFYDTSTDFEGDETYDVNVGHLQEQLGIGNGYHFVHMKTHGEQNLWATETGPFYYSEDALDLHNPLPCIITTTSCKTNAFDAFENPKFTKDPCLSEAFIRSPFSGVVAYLGSSRSGLVDQVLTIGPSLSLNAYFYEFLFRNEEFNFAKLVSRAKERLNIEKATNRWVVYSVNPIGDPEMPIYTDSPEKFTTPNYSWDGTNLHVETGLENCTIAITDKSTMGNNYFQVYKDTRQATFTGLAKGDYTLCITKHNYIPYMVNITSKIDYIQSKVIDGKSLYTGSTISIGRNVTTTKPAGPVTIWPESTTIIDATNSVTLDRGFNCMKGAVLEIK